MTGGALSGRKLKEKVFELLRSETFDASLRELREVPPRRVVNPLFSALASQDTAIKWRAVRAMGHLVASLADQDLEPARDVVRRLMWSLNEDSGGIGWGAPEAMGDILARHDGLANEFAPILVSYIRRDGNFLDNSLLQRGAIWALGRLGQSRPDLLKSLGAAAHLLPFLASPDATLRGLAAWSLGWLGATEARPLLRRLLQDRAEAQLYQDQRLASRPVGDLAEEALALLNKI